MERGREIDRERDIYRKTEREGERGEGESRKGTGRKDRRAMKHENMEIVERRG